MLRRRFRRLVRMRLQNPVPSRTMNRSPRLSMASNPAPLSPTGEEPSADQTEDDGSEANTRLSNRFTSKPGSFDASRSIAAIRFSNCRRASRR